MRLVTHNGRGAVTHNGRVKNEAENARFDARERRLSLVKNEGRNLTGAALVEGRRRAQPGTPNTLGA